MFKHCYGMAIYVTPVSGSNERRRNNSNEPNGAATLYSYPIYEQHLNIVPKGISPGRRQHCEPYEYVMGFCIKDNKKSSLLPVIFYRYKDAS